VAKQNSISLAFVSGFSLFKRGSAFFKEYPSISVTNDRFHVTAQIDHQTQHSCNLMYYANSHARCDSYTRTAFHANALCHSEFFFAPRIVI
jgi:hypothetical protein